LPLVFTSREERRRQFLQSIDRFKKVEKEEKSGWMVMGEKEKKKNAHHSGKVEFWELRVGRNSRRGQQ